MVRINKSKGVFDNSYLPNSTTEVFQMFEVKHTAPITHEVSDKTGELIVSGSCEKELLKVIQKKTFNL